MAMLHISVSVQAPTYERTAKTCRRCGAAFMGNHWTKPPCASQRTEYVLEGRVLGWCEACLYGEERRQERQERQAAAMRRPPKVEHLKRPARTREADDAPPF